MADSGRLAHHLQHVEVAVGVERIARVVGGEGDADPALLHLVHEGDAAPARCPRGSPALEVQVAHREAHHAQAGPGDEVEGRKRLGLLLDRERAAVAGGDRGVEPGLEHAFGHVAEVGGGRIAGLVHVQVHRHSALRSLVEQADEPGTKLGMRHDDAPEHAVRCGYLVHDRPEGRLVPEHVDAAKVHRLEVDPPRPGGPQLPEDAEGDRVLGRKGVEVGADRPRAVGEGRAERELHPAANVRCGPAGRAVGGDREPRGVGGAVRIGGARPDLALVEMGVQVHERGEDHRALHLHALARPSRDDPSSLDGEIEGREAPRRPDEAGRRGQVRERETRHVREGHEVRRPAHLLALLSTAAESESMCRRTHRQGRGFLVATCPFVAGEFANRADAP